jgi:uncharacterized protein (DUF2147 family)
MKVTSIAAGMCLALASPLIANAAGDPTGIWSTEDGRARIRVEKCGADQEHLCGHVVWLKEPLTESGQPLLDSNNPDPMKRASPILGLEILLALSRRSADEFEGKVYNSEDGKTYDVIVASAGPTTLKVRGCFLAVLCGSETWTRTTDVLPSQLTAKAASANGPRPKPNPGH